MEIVLFSTGCPKCSILEKKLQAKNISFTLEKNIEELISAGYKSAPVLKIDGTYYLFKEACDWVNAQEG